MHAASTGESESWATLRLWRASGCPACRPIVGVEVASEYSPAFAHLGVHEEWLGVASQVPKEDGGPFGAGARFPDSAHGKTLVHAIEHRGQAVTAERCVEVTVPHGNGSENRVQQNLVIDYVKLLVVCIGPISAAMQLSSVPIQFPGRPYHDHATVHVPPGSELPVRFRTPIETPSIRSCCECKAIEWESKDRIDVVRHDLDVEVNEGDFFELEHAECFVERATNTASNMAVTEVAQAADLGSSELATASSSQTILDVLRHANVAVISTG